jgi:hypothetical protein
MRAQDLDEFAAHKEREKQAKLSQAKGIFATGSHDEEAVSHSLDVAAFADPILCSLRCPPNHLRRSQAPQVSRHPLPLPLPPLLLLPLLRLRRPLFPLLLQLPPHRCRPGLLRPGQQPALLALAPSVQRRQSTRRSGRLTPYVARSFVIALLV